MHGGKRNNAGRPKGSTNKNNEFREAIKEGVSVERVLREIDELEEGKDRVSALLKLLEFAYPKMKAVEHSGKDGSDLPSKIEFVVKRNNEG